MFCLITCCLLTLQGQYLPIMRSMCAFILISSLACSWGPPDSYQHVSIARTARLCYETSSMSHFDCMPSWRRSVTQLQIALERFVRETTNSVTFVFLSPLEKDANEKVLRMLSTYLGRRIYASYTPTYIVHAVADEQNT